MNRNAYRKEPMILNWEKTVNTLIVAMLQ